LPSPRGLDVVTASIAVTVIIATVIVVPVPASSPPAAPGFSRLPGRFFKGFLSVTPGTLILFDGVVGIVAGLFRVSPIQVLLRPGQLLVHLFLPLGILDLRCRGIIQSRLR